MIRPVSGTLLTLALSAIGCAPRVVLPRPVEWPESWNGRTHFATPAAFIYARTASEAGEADRLVRDSVSAFQRATGATPSRGVVILTDESDPLIIPDADAMLAWIDRTQPQSGKESADDSADPGDASSSQPASQPAADRARSWEKQKKKFEELGFSMDVLLRCLPLRVPPGELCGTLGFSTSATAQVTWGVAIPTRSVCRNTSSRMISAVMESKEITFAQRLLVGPWIPLLKSIAADELAAEREPVLYRAFIDTQPGWDADKKARRLAEYRRQHEQRRATRMAARESDIRRRATRAPAGSQPVTTQPAATQQSPDL